MTIKLFDTTRDDVVDATVGLGSATYDFAISKLLPLINRLDIQRRVQDPKFYSRLARDIVAGCVMPPITIAFLVKDLKKYPLSNKSKFEDFCNRHIADGFVLDGIQRLNTLSRAKKESPNKFPGEKTLFINVIVCSSMDSLLYRMITLNNGQRPMTMRHQIEILTEQLDFSGTDLKIRTERQGGSRKMGYFRQGDVVLAYLAFLSESTTVDTQKLIQERLDQILAAKVQDTPPSPDTPQFFEVLKLMEKWSSRKRVEVWFKVPNNLIGFCAGARSGLPEFRKISVADFEVVVEGFEAAFSAFDVSKIKLGQARRDCLAYFVGHFKDLKKADIDELTDTFAKVIA